MAARAHWFEEEEPSEAGQESPDGEAAADAPANEEPAAGADDTPGAGAT